MWLHPELCTLTTCVCAVVLSFYGGGVNSDANPYLVTELMERGCLKSLLHDLAKPITWTHRLVFASDIAAAMRYLHDDAGAVHRGKCRKTALLKL